MSISFSKASAFYCATLFLPTIPRVFANLLTAGVLEFSLAASFLLVISAFNYTAKFFLAYALATGLNATFSGLLIGLSLFECFLTTSTLGIAASIGTSSGGTTFFGGLPRPRAFISEFSFLNASFPTIVSPFSFLQFFVFLFSLELSYSIL